jgi:hypothetical protein
VVSIDGPERRTMQVAGLLPATGRVADFERLSRYRYRPRAGAAVVNPLSVPCLAIYPDEVGVATAAARIASQHLPSIVTLDPSGWSVEGTRAPGWYPSVGMSFGEWV